MRSVVQRVSRAEVRVGGKVSGRIAAGLVALIGVERGDSLQDAEYLAIKIAGLRVWGDESGRASRATGEAGGGVLAISQFTLLGDVRHGLRPSWDRAAPAVEAEPLYAACVQALRASGLQVECGVFGAEMELELVNLGPVTILLDSRRAL